jgi:hypothetical protein
MPYYRSSRPVHDSANSCSHGGSRHRGGETSGLVLTSTHHSSIDPSKTLLLDSISSLVHADNAKITKLKSQLDAAQIDFDRVDRARLQAEAALEHADGSRMKLGVELAKAREENEKLRRDLAMIRANGRQGTRRSHKSSPSISFESSLADRINDQYKLPLSTRIKGGITKPLTERLADTATMPEQPDHVLPPIDFNWRTKGTIIPQVIGDIFDPDLVLPDTRSPPFPNSPALMEALLLIADDGDLNSQKTVRHWVYKVYHNRDLYNYTSPWFQEQLDFLTTGDNRSSWVVKFTKAWDDKEQFRCASLAQPHSSTKPTQDDGIPTWHSWAVSSSERLADYMDQNVGHGWTDSHLSLRHTRRFRFLAITRPDFQLLTGFQSKKQIFIEFWANHCSHIFAERGFYTRICSEYNIHIAPNFYPRRMMVPEGTQRKDLTLLRTLKFFASIGVTQAIADDFHLYFIDLTTNYITKTNRRLWLSTAKASNGWYFDWKSIQRTKFTPGQELAPAYPGAPSYYPPLPNSYPTLNPTIFPLSSASGGVDSHHTSAPSGKLPIVHKLQVDAPADMPIDGNDIIDIGIKRPRASTGNLDTPPLKCRKIKSAPILMSSHDNDNFMGPTDAMNAMMMDDDDCDIDIDPNNDETLIW